VTTILIIEDEGDVREILSDLLSVENFNVLEAENGSIGCQLARDFQPDLILCDIMMPELDGYGVFATLRDNPETATIPFIFLSAKADRIDFRIGMDLGADDYLTKPFTRDELLAAISTRLKKHLSLQQHYTVQLQQTEQNYKSQLQQAAKQRQYLLYHDNLTDLPNQLALREKFDRIVANLGKISDRTSKKPVFVPVCYLDLDRFARVNEELGYEVGDRCLRMTVDRIRECMGNPAILARIGGDEFALLLEPVESKPIAEQRAASIVEHLAPPISIDDREVVLTASIGVSFYPRDSRQLDTLLNQSKQAMRQAQQQGGNQAKCYSVALSVGSPDRLALETDLRYALERAEFALHYQPQVDLATGEIVGAEALLRWHHPTRGAVSPARFVPIAEENGSIVEIGEWVLKTACQQNLEWQQMGLRPIGMAVNLSGRQFDRPDLCRRLKQLLGALDFAPRDLELELTETILVCNPEFSVRVLQELRALGASIAIDDFGTGYSSLGYLQQFPFDVLKIDRCFVCGLDRNPKNAAIANALIDMAHQMGLTAVAEGVETAEELAFLRQHHCDRIQGYLFSRPLPASEFAALLKQDRRLELR